MNFFLIEVAAIRALSSDPGEVSKTSGLLGQQFALPLEIHAAMRETFFLHQDVIGGHFGFEVQMHVVNAFKYITLFV
jgi:hypothetical protein